MYLLPADWATVYKNPHAYIERKGDVKTKLRRSDYAFLVLCKVGVPMKVSKILKICHEDNLISLTHITADAKRIAKSLDHDIKKEIDQKNSRFVFRDGDKYFISEYAKKSLKRKSSTGLHLERGRPRTTNESTLKRDRSKTPNRDRSRSKSRGRSRSKSRGRNKSRSRTPKREQNSRFSHDRPRNNYRRRNSPYRRSPGYSCNQHYHCHCDVAPDYINPYGTFSLPIIHQPPYLSYNMNPFYPPNFPKYSHNRNHSWSTDMAHTSTPWNVSSSTPGSHSGSYDRYKNR